MASTSGATSVRPSFIEEDIQAAASANTHMVFTFGADIEIAF